jgi:putative ABC transport system permease protein
MFHIIGKHNITGGVSWEGKNPDDVIDFHMEFVNYDFIETHGIEMKEGRAFSKDFGSDDSKIICNETAVKVMGLKDPIGNLINVGGENRQIIGVTRDFHFESLHTKVNPMLITLAQPSRNLKMMVKIKKGTEKEALNRLRMLYENYNPGFVFEYKFLDEDYQAQYAAEKRVSILSRYFAGLAILISCLGLFGLAAFTAQRRTKEIGIRIVHGSTVSGIVRLLSGEFTKLVLLSVLIALPLSYFITNNWLNKFSYRIPLEWWYFIVSGLIALIIAWITVGSQAIRAANINPAECLKDE